MATFGERATHCKRGHAFTLENTYLISRNRGAFQRCKTCDAAKRRTPEMRAYMKRYRFSHKYGLTEREVSDLLVSQDGLCALCYERPATDIDHDHETGQVRGMLCHRCNVALGVLGDSKESIRWVLEYVSTPRLKEVV